MPSEPRRLWRGEDGAALIEAALVLPLLLLMVFATVDLSLYLWRGDLATKAVQLGIRRAVVSDSVAEGPGLTPEESRGYWDGLTPGQSCFPAGGSGGPCPAFRVRCNAREGCVCEAGRCGFSVSLAKLRPILSAMRAAMPEIEPENVELTYATNGLGYVGRPPPVPVDVTLRLVGLAHAPLFLGPLLGTSLSLKAVAILPSEDLVTR